VLDRDEIARLIPHAGTMVLLDRVVAWDDRTITCVARSHRAPDNPLRQDGAIAGLCGIEFCLQASAVHGALMAGERQPVGYLVRLGDVSIAVESLDDLGEELVVHAEIVHSLPNGHSYSFTLGGAEGAPAVHGRATIALVG
jgi:predicted hotdog family 3-hydroxylacyl-ACP dehydratase